MKLAGKTDVGRVRQENQDDYRAGELPGGAVWALVCDGMGGAKGGREASQGACNVIEQVFQEQYAQCGAGQEGAFLKKALISANRYVFNKAAHEESLAGMGTTAVCALVRGGEATLCHAGDSRAYLYRDGKLAQLTHDHSYVQELVDCGTITQEQAEHHPQKNIITRALGVDYRLDPEFTSVAVHPGDLLLLCSDGLCGVLEDSTLEEVLSTCADQEECAQRLVSMALRAGSTDNVTAVIADATLALDADAFDLPHQTPLVGGAASASLETIADIVNEPVASAPPLREGKQSPAARAAALRSGKDPNEEPKQPEQRVAQPSSVREDNGDRVNTDTGEIPIVQKRNGRISADPNDPEVAKAIRNEHIEERKTKRSRKFRNRIITILIIILVLLGVAGVGVGTYRWSQTKYYIGDNNGKVAIFQGVPTSIFGAKLSHAVTDTNMKTSDLPPSWREQLDQGISFDTYGEAKSHTRLIKKQLNDAKRKQEAKQQEKAAAEQKAKDEAAKKAADQAAQTNKSGGDKS